MPRLSRPFMSKPRGGVEKTACDAAFDVAEAAHTKSLEKLRQATATCLYTAGRQLLSAARLFDQSEPALLDFLTTFTRGLADRDFVTLGAACRNFLLSINRTSIKWGDDRDPEANIVSAIDSYDGALNAWSQDSHSSAHSRTVQCRASLSKLGE